MNSVMEMTLKLVVLGNDAMGQLVKQNRSKEKQAGENSHAPELN